MPLELVEELNDISLSYVGVPKLINTVQGHIQNISAGDYSSYALVKLWIIDLFKLVLMKSL